MFSTAAAYKRVPEPSSSTGAGGDQLLFDRPSFDADSEDVRLVSAADPSSSLSSAATGPLPSSSQMHPSTLSAAAAPHIPPAGHMNDGVFSNLSAVDPQLQLQHQRLHLLGSNGSAKLGDDASPVPGPPSYQDAVYETTPPYFDSSVVASGLVEDGDAIVEGMPVGNFFTFFVNLIVSMSFDFIGFLLTSMLATSHASKHGSRSGLGITLIRYGLLLKSKSAEAEQFAYRNDPENFENSDQEQIAIQNEWVAYTMMLVGFIVMLRANADFVRVQRIRAAILATNETPAV